VKLYSKGYTIKQRFTGVLTAILVPPILLMLALTAIAIPLAEKAGDIIEWYGRLLESAKKR